jgi:serine protease Do
LKISVTTNAGKTYTAHYIAGTQQADLAFLKIDSKEPLPFISPTDLSPNLLGETVLVLGNPLGYGSSVARGILSAKNRTVAVEDIEYKNLIQTDAAINPGNSGGALVDSRGELIGINTFLISGSGSFAGMGFAIPTQIVEPTVNTLIRDGKVEHGYIGIQIADVTPDNAKFFHLNKAAGALVSDVTPDSPGSSAGLKTGDVITELDGKAITDAGELQVLVGQKRPGDTIQLDVMREDKPTTVSVKLGDLNNTNGGQVAGAAEHKGRWGLSLGDLDQNARQELQQEGTSQGVNVHGAIVNSVVPGSPADNAGISQGDVIMEVNRKPMHSAADVAQALGGIAKGQDALVLVWSNGGSTFRVLHPSE